MATAAAGIAKVGLTDGTGTAITSTAAALDVNIKSGAAGGTQYAEGATAATATGTLAMGKSGTTLKAAQTDASGNLRIDLSQTSANTTALKVDGSAVTQPVSGTVTANQGGVWTMQPGNTANTTPWLTSLQPATSGGWSVSSQTALTNTATAVKAAAGQFGGYMFYNPNSTVIYIQVFNVASGSVTLGTTTPTYVVPIPAAAAANIEFANGIAHSTAITIAATTTATGSAAPTTALTGFVIYK